MCHLNNLIISSESCVNTSIEYSNVNEGDIIRFDIENNLKLTKIYNINEDKSKTTNYKSANCLFEYIYFMNKNSKWNNINIEDIRGKYGKSLAEEEESDIVNNPENYIVIGIPNSGVASAKEYAKTLNIQYKQYIKKILI